MNTALLLKGLAGVLAVVVVARSFHAVVRAFREPEPENCLSARNAVLFFVVCLSAAAASQFIQGKADRWVFALPAAGLLPGAYFAWRSGDGWRRVMRLTTVLALAGLVPLGLAEIAPSVKSTIDQMPDLQEIGGAVKAAQQLSSASPGGDLNGVLGIFGGLGPTGAAAPAGGDQQALMKLLGGSNQAKTDEQNLEEIAKTDPEMAAKVAKLLGRSMPGVPASPGEVLLALDSKPAAPRKTRPTAAARRASVDMGRLRGDLEHADPSVREKAIVSIHGMGEAGRPAVPQVIRALEDESEVVRGRAFLVLGALKPAEDGVVPALSAKLASDGEDRMHAIKALGSLGPEAAPAVPGLIEALTKGVPEERLPVLDALGNVGPAAADAAPFVQRYRDDPDLVLRWQARETLQKIGAAPKKGGSGAP